MKLASGVCSCVDVVVTSELLSSLFIIIIIKLDDIIIAFKKIESKIGTNNLGYRFLSQTLGYNFNLLKTRTRPLGLFPWSSLDKGESLACKITSPFSKKIGCFKMQFFKYYIKKQPSFLSHSDLARRFGFIISIISIPRMDTLSLDCPVVLGRFYPLPIYIFYLNRRHL